MEENLKWLWAAFSVAWALHLGYVVLLSRRTRRLERELDHVSAQLNAETEMPEARSMDEFDRGVQRMDKKLQEPGTDHREGVGP